MTLHWYPRDMGKYARDTALRIKVFEGIYGEKVHIVKG